MELISEHWAYIVIRELFLGPKRFSELQQSAIGITPTVLTTRLRSLIERGIVASRVLAPPARVRVYELTPWGHGLEPVMHALGRWAQESPTGPTSGGLTPDATVLAMRTMVSGARVDPGVSIGLHLHDSRAGQDLAYDYGVVCDGDGLTVERGDVERADADVSIDSSAWAEVVFDGADLPAEAVTGDEGAVARLVAAMRRAAAEIGPADRSS
ncbi:Transcriptional regulator, HxlR family [Actinomycetales bacterium JB111]|nr:Transcriptional regulator, HxlR family [Actinomycetales bacterium JB111]